MSRVGSIRLLAEVLLVSALCQVGSTRPARATDYVIFKIWNDTKVPITALYDKDSRQDNWGINDLQNAVQPGHYFYIRLAQNSYAHCPGMLHDVKVVFANGDVKLLRKVDVCQYDNAHVNRT